MVVGFNCERTVISKCGEQPKPQRSAEKTHREKYKESDVWYIMMILFTGGNNYLC